MYFPTSNYSEEEIDKTYETLQTIIDGIPKGNFLIIQGDFNAKLGGLENDFEEVIGRYTHGIHNDRGICLANFCSSNKLWVANTSFKRRKGRLWTWESPDKKTKNQIDFQIYRKLDQKKIRNCGVITRITISDHRWVASEIENSLIKIRRPTKDKKKDLKSLDDPKIRNNYQRTFNEVTDQILTPMTLEDPTAMYECLVEGIKAGKEQLPTKNPDKKEQWISDNTNRLMRKRDEARKCMEMALKSIGSYEMRLKTTYKRTN